MAQSRRHSPPVVTRFIPILCLLASLFVATASAYLFGPGKYSGVVVFDRWGTCYLMSGPYVNYVASEVKSELLSYNGRAIEVDASKVDAFGFVDSDPMIRKYKIIGPAPAPKRNQLDGLRLVAVQTFGQLSKPQFLIEFLNNGKFPIRLDRDEIGILLFEPAKPGRNNSYDGSNLLISRSGIDPGSHISSQQIDGLKTAWGYIVDPNTRPPSLFSIAPGQSIKTLIRFKVEPGPYQFMFAYGGAVSSEASLVSNAIFFEVSGDGRAKVTD